MSEKPAKPAAAVIAAAGFSRRMGRFKQLLPWGDGTVIEAVAASFAAAGAQPLLVITGHRGAEVAERLANSPARVVPNPDYRTSEMLRSYQVGVAALTDEEQLPDGVLLALGDQPHLPVAVIRRVMAQALEAPNAVVIPSHQQRRGHPIYLPRRLWPDLLALAGDESLRDLLNRHGGEIVYVTVDTASIRQDMDRLEEYTALRAKYKS